MRAAHEGGVTVMVAMASTTRLRWPRRMWVWPWARGATASSEAADIVLVVDRLDRLIEAVRIARRSRFIALPSIVTGMALSAAGMAVASAGMLPPVAGASVQEVIDVLVILNAWRVLGSGSAKRPRDAGHAEVGQQFRAEHQELLPGVKRIRHNRRPLDTMPPATARAEIDRLYIFLAEELVPHEDAEDPTATMSRAHMEIAHLVRVFGRTLEDLPPEGSAVEDLRELRRILYGLYAILRLHFAQEDESYLALIDEGSPVVKQRRTEGGSM